MNAKRVLLVSPVFHGYWSAFEAALEYNGHNVVSHCYDHWHSRRDRWRNALAHRKMGVAQLAQVRAETTERAIAALRDVKPDAVLVIKGDVLGDSWWDALSETGVPKLLWLYDELERLDYSIDQLRAVGTVSSYSPNDVTRLQTAGIDAELLPDGYDSLTQFAPRPSPAVNIVGARYPERERIVEMLTQRSIIPEAFGREWSRHPWDRMRTGQWRANNATGYRDVARAEYYGVMAGSLATLNIHGDGHDGLSMRTFEAPGVGGLQIIDRPSVADFYDPGVETLLYENDNQLVELIQRAEQDPAWAAEIRQAGRKRTLAQHTLIHRMREVATRWA